MVRSFPLLYLAATLLAVATTHAMEDSVSFRFDDTDNDTFMVDKFDTGPSSGPFSNKPGWPKLDGPGGNDDPTATAPPKVMSTPDVNNAGLIIAAPTTQVPVKKGPITQAPAAKSPTTQSPATKPHTTQAPAAKTPSAKSPTTQSPATKPHTTQAPAAKTPSAKSPTTQAPATKTSVGTPAVVPGPAKGTGATLAPTVAKPDTTSPKNPAQRPIVDPPRCAKDSVQVSVKGVKGTYCVSNAGEICSAQHPKGNCPGPQSGLEKGSHCGIVKSGAHRCLPGSGGSKHKSCHD